MAHTNPFFVTRGESTRLINAANAAHAVTFALADQKVSVKAASGRAMSAFIAAGGQIETADAAPIDSTSLLRDRGLTKTAEMVEGMGGVVTGISEATAGILSEHVMPELKAEHDAAALHTGHADEIAEEGTGKAARKAKLAGDVE